MLLEAAHKVSVYLSSICGGDGYCGKCKVIVDEGQFQSRPTGLLTPQEVRENVVLACQTMILSDMTITIPKWHSLETGQILTDSDAERFRNLKGRAEAVSLQLDPLVPKLYREMALHSDTVPHAHHHYVTPGVMTENLSQVDN